MARISGIYLALASLCLVFNIAVAQVSSSTTAAPASSTTAAPSYPINCQSAVPLTINGTLLLGTWYEAARKPVGGGNNTEQCVQLVVSYTNGTIDAAITYSTDPNNLWINQTTVTHLQYSSQLSDVFPGEWNSTVAGVTTVYKVLETDNSTYALVCGYVPVIESTTTTVATTSSSSTTASTPTSSTVSSSTAATSTTTPAPASVNPAGAFIFTRVRQINATQLASLTSAAVAHFNDFNGVSTVTQSDECTQGGASSTVPALALILAVVYSLLKFAN